MSVPFGGPDGDVGQTIAEGAETRRRIRMWLNMRALFAHHPCYESVGVLRGSMSFVSNCVAASTHRLWLSSEARYIPNRAAATVA